MAKMTAYNTIPGLNKALRQVVPEAAVTLRGASRRIADKVASEAAGMARSQGGINPVVATSILGANDRVPVVKSGGTKKLPAHSSGRPRRGKKQTVGNVLWGAEFGGGKKPRTQQFQPHRGTKGYFLWPTVRALSPDIQKEYSEALDDALKAIR